MSYLPGPGDQSTWGAVTSSRDPRAESGSITFDAKVGMGDVDVTVTAEVWSFGETGEIQSVMWNGVDVTELLDGPQIERLEQEAEVAMHNKEMVP